MFVYVVMLAYLHASKYNVYTKLCIFAIVLQSQNLALETICVGVIRHSNSWLGRANITPCTSSQAATDFTDIIVGLNFLFPLFVWTFLYHIKT